MLCRLCLDEGDDGETLRPCLCKGTSAHIHRTCLETWRKTGRVAFVQCPSCKAKYKFVGVSDDSHLKWSAFVFRIALDGAMIVTFIVAFVALGTRATMYASGKDVSLDALEAFLYTAFLLLGLVVVMALVIGAKSAPPNFSGPACAKTAVCLGVGVTMWGLYSVCAVVVDVRAAQAALHSIRTEYVVADYDDPSAVSMSETQLFKSIPKRLHLIYVGCVSACLGLILSAFVASSS